MSTGLGYSLLRGRVMFAFEAAVALKACGLGLSLLWGLDTFALVAAVDMYAYMGV